MITKICQYCGKIYESKANNSKYCKGPHYMTCPVCGKSYLVTNNEKLKFPPTACSYECRTIRRTETSIKKYGCTAPGNNTEARRKSSETMMKKYGVPHAMMSEEIREKSKKTLIEKYGVDNVGKNSTINKKGKDTQRNNNNGKLAFNTEKSYMHRHITVMEKYGHEVFADKQIREKAKKTMIERYGAPYNMQVPELKEKQQKTLFEHYGYTAAFACPEIRKKSEQTMVERYGVTNASYSEELVKKAEQTILERYGKLSKYSKINDEFASLLSENGIEFIQEKFIGGRDFARWYDFCIDSQKMMIELNPTYTHNILGNHWCSNITKDYHIAKSNLAKEYGYRCIHIFDWDDKNKIIGMISKKKKIYARDCRIFNIYKNIADEFTEENHLNGKCKGQFMCLGLLHDNELVQIMTFGKPRYDNNYSIELLRFCTKIGYQVVGGASRLFNFATKYMELDNIISYCDLSKFSGDVYEKMGMSLLRITPPQEIWSKNTDKITANLLRQRGYDQLFNANHGKGTSNEKLMLENGWLPVYDCGQAVYEYRSNK